MELLDLCSKNYKLFFSFGRDKHCNFKHLPIKIPGRSGESHALRLCNAFWNPQVQTC